MRHIRRLDRGECVLNWCDPRICSRAEEIIRTELIVFDRDRLSR